MGGVFSSVPKTLTLVPGVEASLLGREWRCKFADGGGADGGLINSKALEEAQRLLDDHLNSLKGINGVEGIHRIVCGGCKDFKIIITAQLDQYEAWEQSEFAPEKEFLEKLRGISGISNVETQKYTVKKEHLTVENPGDVLTLVPGVVTDSLAREWRLKFTKSEGDPAEGALINSKSLEEAQKVLEPKILELTKMQCPMSMIMRIVCGGCDDFKVTIVMPVKEFKAWEAGEHKPEKDILEQFSKIDGVHSVETQTYTFQTYV